MDLATILSYWRGHPDALIGLAALQGLYLAGIGPLRKKYKLADEVDPRQTATFTAGVLTIFVAEVSPVHVLADNYLFSVHMVQHVLLTLIAPPLLILGTPEWLVRPLLRPNWAFRAARIAVHPVMALAAFNIVFSLWHFPALYNATLHFHSIHYLEHMLLLVTAFMMWWPLTSVMPELPRLSYPMQMGYLFLLSVAQIIVFAVVTFSREPLYDFYVHAPRLFDISPLSDQQIGGIIMKVGGGFLFLALFVIAFFRWFNEEEKKRAAEQQNDYDYYGYQQREGLGD